MSQSKLKPNRTKLMITINEYSATASSTTRKRNPFVHNHDIGLLTVAAARSTVGGNGRGVAAV